jgi:tetratricopeptide (TPR) repeat protein
MISRAIEADPSVPEFHSHLGLTLCQLGRFEDAVQSCRRALAINPDMALAYHNLGVAMKGQGKFQEVIECCRRVLDIEPRHCHAGRGNRVLGKSTRASAQFPESPH